jgi:putative exosortase-associated protein (TIGR04073 family)
MKGVSRWLALGLLVVGIGTTSAWADDGAPMAGGRDRVDEMMGRYNLAPAFSKLGRGVSNALLGWLEVPLNVHKHYTTSDTVGSGLTGAAVGLFKGAVRMGVGVYETVTFFLPYPEQYAPILPTLEYFQKTTKRKPLPLE